MEDQIYGTAGCLYAPDLNIKVPLYTSNAKTTNQQIVDEENSAILMKNFHKGHCDLIADHANQGFNKIKNSHLDTMLCIVTENSTQFYTCVGMLRGQNKKTELVADGGLKVTKIKFADLCCYCCNDDKGINISMVFFKKTVRYNYSIFDYINK